MKAKIKEMKVQEEKARQRKGVPGKGHKEGYKRFCPFCHLEWFIDGID